MRLIGFCFDMGAVLVYELLPEGSLDGHLCALARFSVASTRGTLHMTARPHGCQTGEPQNSFAQELSCRAITCKSCRPSIEL